MTRYDDVDLWAEEEAGELASFDADLELAEMRAAGDAIHAARARGICCHQGVAGYRNPPCYPEQMGLKPGQLRCTDGCGQVFGSDEEWARAMDAAITGEED